MNKTNSLLLTSIITLGLYATEERDKDHLEKLTQCLSSIKFAYLEKKQKEQEEELQDEIKAETAALVLMARALKPTVTGVCSDDDAQACQVAQEVRAKMIEITKSSDWAKILNPDPYYPSLLYFPGSSPEDAAARINNKIGRIANTKKMAFHYAVQAKAQSQLLILLLNELRAEGFIIKEEVKKTEEIKETKTPESK